MLIDRIDPDTVLVALAPYEIKLLADRLQEEFNSHWRGAETADLRERRICELRRIAANARARRGVRAWTPPMCRKVWPCDSELATSANS